MGEEAIAWAVALAKKKSVSQNWQQSAAQAAELQSWQHRTKRSSWQHSWLYGDVDKLVVGRCLLEDADLGA